MGYVRSAWDSSIVLRLPRGRFFFQAKLFGRDADNGLTTVQFVEPEIAVTRDVETTLDARAAEPVGMVVDRPEAEDGQTLLSFTRTGRCPVRGSGQRSAHGLGRSDHEADRAGVL
ncbi:hypothetical protein ACIA5G_45540 [Amycolatopsis sp. NPDC051758]|uniref:hypothetical protein n=1 Tax=Amycolatopsis sp. NPDC051758 TaxID=3363935 RepID=UPI00378AD76C